MNDLQFDLAESIREYRRINRQTNRQLKHAPEGRLRLGRSHNSCQFFHVLPGIKGRTYLRKDQRDLVAALAQKDYLERLSRLTSARLAQMEALAADYEPGELGTVYDALPPAERALVDPLFESAEDFAARWAKAEYDRKSPPVFSYQVTNRGERVRSKTEKIIADKLAELGIPYRYEQALYLEGYGQIHPDFTLLDRERRREVYWEHLGMLDQEEYARENLTRIEAYIRNGLLPGERLILTFEADNQTLAPEVLEALIRQVCE